MQIHQINALYQQQQAQYQMFLSSLLPMHPFIPNYMVPVQESHPRDPLMPSVLGPQVLKRYLSQDAPEK